MATVTFSNNLGEIYFEQCLISIGDTWQWNGSTAVRTKAIEVRGHLARKDDGMEAILTRSHEDIVHGETGTLTLPWTVLPDIKLGSLEMGDATWSDYIPISATFSDPNPDDHIYVLTFFGFDLHNPRLMLPLPSKNIYDDYLQMGQVTGAIPDTDLRYGALRSRGQYRMLDISLSGAIPIEGPSLPDGLLSTLTQRVGYGDVVNNELPAGYPNIFRLSEAIPQIPDHMNLNGVYIARSRLSWQVENGIAQIDVNMRCQPQRIELQSE